MSALETLLAPHMRAGMTLWTAPRGEGHLVTTLHYRGAALAELGGTLGELELHSPTRWLRHATPSRSRWTEADSPLARANITMRATHALETFHADLAAALLLGAEWDARRIPPQLDTPPERRGNLMPPLPDGDRATWAWHAGRLWRAAREAGLWRAGVCVDADAHAAWRDMHAAQGMAGAPPFATGAPARPDPWDAVHDLRRALDAAELS